MKSKITCITFIIVNTKLSKLFYIIIIISIFKANKDKELELAMEEAFLKSRL